MILDMEATAPAVRIAVPQWSAAEILDTPLPDNTTLRALVCRLSAGRWQWSILSLGRDCGELICSGIEHSAIAARETVAAEIVKCLEDPIG
jgi:hypothetical protein